MSLPLAFGSVVAVPSPASATATVTAYARQWVNVRAGAATTTASLGSLSGGQSVSVLCQEAGGVVTGPGGTTDLWNRMADGRYVSDSYLTGHSALPPRCPTPPGTATARQWVNVRAGASVAAASVGSLSGGQRVTVECQVTGGSVSGPGGVTDLWSRLGAGRFVSDSYLTGHAARPPRCAPPPVLTTEQTAFLAMTAGPARQSFVTNRVPASVTLAQAILESGWGRGNLARTANNYFGAKCTAAGPGAVAIGCRTFATRECGAAGCYATDALFRVYASIDDSMRDHALILAKPRYAAAFAYTADPDRFAVEIHKGGYATDPEYPKLLSGIMAKYDLYRYDR